MEFKVSTLMIVMLIFIAAMATAGDFVIGINQNYPDGNITAEWNNTFNKMATLNRTAENIYTEFATGEEGTETGEGSELDFITGTLGAIKNGYNTLALVPAIITDFVVTQEDLDIPWWLAPTIISIIIISVVFTVGAAFLRGRI